MSDDILNSIDLSIRAHQKLKRIAAGKTETLTAEEAAKIDDHIRWLSKWRDDSFSYADDD